MGLPNMLKNRMWSFVILLAAGVLIGSLATGAIMSYTARNTSASQELVPQEVSSEDGAAAQPSIVPSLPAGGETVSTTSDQSQIDRGDLDTYQGIPVGFTEEGYPYLGHPSAPITLEEYSDFLCPFCERHFIQTLPTLLDEYISSGQVKYVFRDMPLVSLHPTAPIGHVAARCVAEQGAAYFWAMHDALFARQNEWRQLPDPSDFVAAVAEGIGVDMAAYQACLASGGKDSQVQASVAAGAALGFNGTPSFQFIQNESGHTYTLVGAYPVDTFSQWLDALVAGEAPPQDQGQEETASPELPFWANAEGLAPDPERPGFTMAGDQYKGDPNARLVVVEFSDFQCPSCGRHALGTQPALDEQFVNSGQIMWVFKHLPLKEHAFAPAAAVAAECAADQSRFWDMHHLLFEQLDAWSTADEPDAALLALAEGLNLDMEQFSACLGSRQALERVLSDMYDAQGVAQTTPTFIAIYGGKGAVFRGSRPVDEFVPILEDLLEEARAGE
jgi:protein-disulfide isomerase